MCKIKNVRQEGRPQRQHAVQFHLDEVSTKCRSPLERKGDLGLPGAGVGMGVNGVWAPDTSYSA